jgi:hypothetical protein
MRLGAALLARPSWSSARMPHLLRPLGLELLGDEAPLLGPKLLDEPPQRSVLRLRPYRTGNRHANLATSEQRGAGESPGAAAMPASFALLMHAGLDCAALGWRVCCESSNRDAWALGGAHPSPALALGAFTAPAGEPHAARAHSHAPARASDVDGPAEATLAGPRHPQLPPASAAARTAQRSRSQHHTHLSCSHVARSGAHGASARCLHGAPAARHHRVCDACIPAARLLAGRVLL